MLIVLIEIVEILLGIKASLCIYSASLMGL